VNCWRSCCIGINDGWAPLTHSLYFASPVSSPLAQWQDRLPRCPSRSHPRSVVSNPPAPSRFRFLALLFLTILFVLLSYLFFFLLFLVHLHLPVSRACSHEIAVYLPRIRRGWVEGEGGIFTSRARRGRHTRTCTHGAHGNTPPGGRERTCGRQGGNGREGRVAER